MQVKEFTQQNLPQTGFHNARNNLKAEVKFLEGHAGKRQLPCLDEIVFIKKKAPETLCGVEEH